MNYGYIQKLVEQLKAENDPSNDELIEFYENKLKQAVSENADRLERNAEKNQFTRILKPYWKTK